MESHSIAAGKKPILLLKARLADRAFLPRIQKLKKSGFKLTPSAVQIG